jgi:BirA family biotin operon repressor/biotin-[acetyl-CoA-carboxylase] ligase
MIELTPPFHLHSYERIDSTNDELRRLAAAGERPGAVALAGEQSAGRGRRNRAWHSPHGNFHGSFLLDPGPDVARAPELVFVAAVALRETLAGFSSIPVQCKWPNDILGGGKKISGMLLELTEGHPPPLPSHLEGEGRVRGGRRLVILGVGVNLIEAPTEALYPATCLSDCGPVITPEQLLQPLCASLAAYLEAWRRDGFDAIRAAWLDHAAGLGEPITARLADGATRSGRFNGLDRDGALLLDGARILAAEVFFAQGKLGREMADASGH